MTTFEDSLKQFPIEENVEYTIGILGLDEFGHPLCFIHPQDKNGITLDFKASGNQILPIIQAQKEAV